MAMIPESDEAIMPDAASAQAEELENQTSSAVSQEPNVESSEQPARRRRRRRNREKLVEPKTIEEHCDRFIDFDPFLVNQYLVRPFSQILARNNFLMIHKLRYLMTPYDVQRIPFDFMAVLNKFMLAIFRGGKLTRSLAKQLVELILEGKHLPVDEKLFIDECISEGYPIDIFQ